MDHVGFLLCKGSTDHVVHFNLDIDHRVIAKGKTFILLFLHLG